MVKSSVTKNTCVMWFHQKTLNSVFKHLWLKCMLAEFCPQTNDYLLFKVFKWRVLMPLSPCCVTSHQFLWSHVRLPFYTHENRLLISVEMNLFTVTGVNIVLCILYISFFSRKRLNSMMLFDLWRGKGGGWTSFQACSGVEMQIDSLCGWKPVLSGCEQT